MPTPIRRPSQSSCLLADDASLAAAAASGQHTAAGPLWDRYSALARGIIRRLLGPDSEAEDLLQEVFLRIFRDIGSLRDPEALRAFIVQITTHAAMSELRKRRVRRWLRLSFDGTLPEAGTRPAADSPARLAMVALYRILDGLDPEARTAFVLHRIEEMELREVAAAMNVSLATVKRRLVDAEARVERLAPRDPSLRPYTGRPAHGEDAATERGSHEST